MIIMSLIDKISVLKPFYNRFPDIDSFNLQIEEKKSSTHLRLSFQHVRTIKHSGTICEYKISKVNSDLSN